MGDTFCPDAPGFDKCVDLSRDSDNCGECGVECDRGSACEDGKCSPPPAADEDVPYDVDTVTDSSLTAAKFMASLPDSFDGQLRITDVVPDMANASFHPRLTDPSAAYYHDPDSSDSFGIAAVAMVGSLPAGLSVATVVSQVKSGNASGPGFSVIDEDTSPDAAFPFVRYQVWVNDAVGTVYYLVWGREMGSTCISCRPGRFGTSKAWPMPSCAMPGRGSPTHCLYGLCDNVHTSLKNCAAIG